MRNSVRVYLIIFTLLLPMFFLGCSSSPVNNEGLMAKDIYDRGHQALLKEHYLEAVEVLGDLQVQYPFGDYAQQGELEKAYAHFKLREYSGVDEVLKRFIRVYPRHPHIEYAYYLRALASYTRGVGYRGKLFKVDKTSRTANHAQQAFQQFSLLIKRFPESRYRADSVQRMEVLRNHLAQHEIHIARFYIKRKAYVAAVNRAKDILEIYPKSVQIPEALAILVQGYRALGMDDLAEDSQRVLLLNFPDSTEWLDD